MITKEELDKKIENWYRAGGECLCPICRFPYQDYRMHPIDEEVLIYYPEFHLNKLCTGDYVKL